MSTAREMMMKSSGSNSSNPAGNLKKKYPIAAFIISGILFVFSIIGIIAVSKPAWKKGFRWKTKTITRGKGPDQPVAGTM